MNPKIEITREEFFKLKKAELKLDLLESGGVDNWQGYSDSLNPDGEKGYGDWVEILEKELLGSEAHA